MPENTKDHGGIAEITGSSTKKVLQGHKTAKSRSDEDGFYSSCGQAFIRIN
ncbi:MAG: hypothetical protein R2741_09055 [Methanolobus sp.]